MKKKTTRMNSNGLTNEDRKSRDWAMSEANMRKLSEARTGSQRKNIRIARVDGKDEKVWIYTGSHKQVIEGLMGYEYAMEEDTLVSDAGRKWYTVAEEGGGTCKVREITWAHLEKTDRDREVERSMREAEKWWIETGGELRDRDEDEYESDSESSTSTIKLSSDDNMKVWSEDF